MGTSLTRRPKFVRDQPFRQAVKQRVDQYFERTGRAKTGGLTMIAKTVIMVVWFGLSYAALVWLASTWWHAVVAAGSLAMAMAGVAMCIHHDANHGAYSRYGWGNRVLQRSLDCLGVSSYLWSWTHNVFHHTYTNVDGIDQDLDLAPLARLAPTQPRRWFHAYQHLYMWAAYAFTVFYFVFVEDFIQLRRARVGPHRFPSPRGLELLAVFASKVVAMVWAIAVPLMYHDWWLVLTVFVVVWLFAGVILGVTFQVAHCAHDTNFPEVSEREFRVPSEWAKHQVEATVGFAHKNATLTWYLGGLNYQIEHHLFPKICHIHYPAIAPIVKQTCQEYGVRYTEHACMMDAVRAHGRWLRSMGAPCGDVPADPVV